MVGDRRRPGEVGLSGVRSVQGHKGLLAIPNGSDRVIPPLWYKAIILVARVQQRS